jgi:ADP-ribose pyrophosphatase
VTVADRPESWPVRRSSVAWRGSAPFWLREDQLSAPERPGHTFSRLVLMHPGAVVVFAVDEEERALVLQQYRHPAGTRFVELPAGLLDVHGEDPLVAARRELLEEGALTAAQWSHLLTTYSSPGVSQERVETYLARGLTAVPDRGGFALEHEEADMTVAWVPVTELLEGVLAGRLTDAPLALAVMAYTLRGRGPGRAAGGAGAVGVQPTAPESA